MAFINRSVPIADVANALDLRFGTNGHIHCWHPDNHKNGDRTASVGIDRKRNRVKCFGCATRPMSPLDLVVDVGKLDLADAALWIAGRFKVPKLPKGKHLVEYNEAARKQYGTEEPIELLVRSGVWETLGASTQRLVPVLLCFAQKQPNSEMFVLEMSYRAMLRYSGLGSASGVSKALKELKALGWMKEHAAEQSINIGPSRPVGKYLLMPHSDEVYELANATFGGFRAEIKAEKELRSRQRQERINLGRKVTDQKRPDAAFIKYDSLYVLSSVIQFGATPCIASICDDRFHVPLIRLDWLYSDFPAARRGS